jgi:hypothetical protein
MPCPTDPTRQATRSSALSALAAGWATVVALLASGCAGWPGWSAAPGAQDPAAPPAPAAAASAADLAPATPASAPVVTSAPAPSDPRRAEDRALRRLLDSQERQRSLAGAELAREIALREPPGDAAAALELALLLAQRAAQSPGVGNGATGDLPRALALVDPVARGNGPERGAARWLQARLADQRRLEEQLERQAQQLRDQQRRIEQLTSQIEALRAIERSLSGVRPAGTPAPPPGPSPATPAPR